MNLTFQVFFVTSLLLAGCASPLGRKEEPESVSRLFAEINGKQITRDDFESYVAFGTENSDLVSERELVRSFIIQEVLLQAAEEARVELEGEEVTVVSQESLNEIQGPEEESAVQLRNFLKIQKYLLAKLALEDQIQLQEVLDYYNQHAEEFQVDERVRVLEILVKDVDTAEAILAGLEPGNFRHFREAATTYSVGATADRGGDLGLFQPGELPFKFEEVIFALKVGEVGPIFRSEHGFHIFMVEERVPRHAQKFHEVQEEILGRLLADRERQALDGFVMESLRDARIFIYEHDTKRLWRDENGS